MRLGSTQLENRVRTTLAVLAGSAFTLVASAGARAETVVITEPVPYAAAPAYSYEAPAYAYDAYAYEAPVITGRTIVTRPSIVAVPQARTVVVQRPQTYVIERPAIVAAPRVYNSRRTYAAPSGGLVAIDSTIPASCSVDINGFERCY